MKKDTVNIKYPCYVQPILNGVKAFYIPNLGLIDEEDEKIENDNYFSDLTTCNDFVIVGEICDNLQYIVYDCVPLEDWNNKNCKITYENRLKQLRGILYGQICNFNKIIDVACDIVDSPIELKDAQKQYLNDGYEGVIIKRMDNLYKWKSKKITEQTNG